jgi:drug/metabolite transporter (DMT)-like permease
VTRRTAVISVIASAACFATLGVLTKWAFAHGAEPLSLLAVRFALAAVVMGGMQAVRDPRALRVSRGDLVRFVGLSFTGYGAASLCYSFAVREIGASVTTVLLYTYPALVSIIGWLFLKERFPPRRVAAVALTFLGCALVANVFSAGSSVTVRGLLLGLGAGLGYAVFNILSFRTLARTPRLTVMSYTFGFSAVAMAIVAGLTGSLQAVAHWDVQAWLAMALIVAVPTFAAVMLYLGGIRRMGAAQGAVVSTLELPFTVMLAAALFVDERLGALQLVGAAIVLAGVVLAEWGSPAGEVEGAAWALTGPDDSAAEQGEEGPAQDPSGGLDSRLTAEGPADHS